LIWFFNSEFLKYSKPLGIKIKYPPHTGKLSIKLENSGFWFWVEAKETTNTKRHDGHFLKAKKDVNKFITTP
jgi:hypothetical protein